MKKKTILQKTLAAADGLESPKATFSKANRKS